MKRIYFTPVGMLLGLLLLMSGSAYAAPQDITMSPTSVSQTIVPGATYNGSFEVINQGNVGYPFRVYATPYHVSGEDYTPDFTLLPNAPKVASWFTFSTTTGYAKPGQTVTIKYSIHMPKNTPPGGYYAVAFGETKFPQTGSSIVLNERVGEIFYLEAAGPVTREGKLLTWESSMFQKPPFSATLRIEDGGGINFPAYINVKVEDAFGQPKYTLQTVKQILPQTIRRVVITWPETPSLGLFKVTGQLSYLQQTQTLPTKWVLIMSPTVRLLTLVVVVAIVLLLIVRPPITNRRSSRRHTSIYRRR
jgi:hypothetical protein